MERSRVQRKAVGAGDETGLGCVLVCKRRGDESFGPALLTSCPTTRFGHNSCLLIFAFLPDFLLSFPAFVNITEEISKRRTFAIISHPDAGKTTLTEKLLLYGGAVQLAGSVTARKNQRATTSD